MKAKTCMKKVFFFVLCLTLACTLSGATIYDRSEILKIMKKVADHQHYSDNEWFGATYYAGIMAAYKASQDTAYLNLAESWGQTHNWMLGGDRDNGFACGQTYAELFLLDSSAANRYKIAALITAQTQMGSAAEGTWNFCDALFMAPPMLARIAAIMGWGTAFDRANTLWWFTHGSLYDTTDHLFYRDGSYIYPARQTLHGKKVFWLRGNGWVVAGTVRVLQYMPVDYPDRPKYVQLLREMCAALAAQQGSDGLWRTSLLDSAQYPTPETSGSAFFCYAMAWGINNGVLDSTTYLPVVKKAWEGLLGKVDANGALRYVQGEGGEPLIFDTNGTAAWAAGGFLMAGSEMWKDPTPPAVVAVNTPLVKDQTIILSWSAAADAESGISIYQIYRGLTVNPTELYATVRNVLAFQDSTGMENTTFHYRIKAINGYGLASFSNDVSATTAPDTVAPVAGVFVKTDRTVLVYFSEPVTIKTAEDSTNYTIDRTVSVLSARLQGDRRSVFLTTSLLSNSVEYTLNVSRITDISKAENVMAPVQKPFSFKLYPGVCYDYFTSYISCSVDYIAGKTPETTGVLKNFDFSPFPGYDIAVRYKGLIDIPSPGNYTFYISSAKGSCDYKLYIDNTLVVNRNRTFDENSGNLTLGEHKHGIMVLYRVGYWEGGPPQLDVSWEGPGIVKQLIPDSVLFFIPDSGYPKTDIQVDRAVRQLPQSYELSFASPNPFNNVVQIRFGVPRTDNSGKQGLVSVCIYDLRGRLVQTLAQGSMSTGYHTVRFDGGKGNNGKLVSGVYFCRMEAKGFTKSIRLLLVK